MPGAGSISQLEESLREKKKGSWKGALWKLINLTNYLKVFATTKFDSDDSSVLSIHPIGFVWLGVPIFNC